MITKIEILADDVHVHFNGENSEIFPNIWLRDHAKDEQNWDKRSSQRKTYTACLLYTSPSPRDRTRSRMPSSA